MSLNIPSLLGLTDAGMDDADVDAAGNIFVSDGLNGRVYRLQPDGSNFESFSIAHLNTLDSDASINIAAACNSSFYVADPSTEVVARYDENGRMVGEFGVPGVLCLCSGPDDLIYVFSREDDTEQINSYDQLGSIVSTITAPVREGAHLDSSLVNMDADLQGNVYVSYSTPPYRIWKQNLETEETITIGRTLDVPDNTILIADITVDRTANILWVLLAFRESGRQMIDAFNTDGEYIGSLQIPRSDNLYEIACAANSSIYLLDTGSGSNAGNLLRISVEM
ncbi:MAG: NHL repeat-containing protein [Armatimonadota bacterium]